MRIDYHPNSGNPVAVRTVMYVTFYCTRRGRGKRWCNKQAGHPGRHRYAPMVSR